MISITAIKRFSICAALLTTLFAHAGAQPKFTITPTSSNAVRVPAGGQATVTYLVTNNLPYEFPLALNMDSLGGTSMGITQVVTGNNPCAVPAFSLKAGASCRLTLQINGAFLGPVGSSRTFAGPQICIYNGEAGHFSCSQPSRGQGLAVTVVQQFAYVTNLTGNTVSICPVNTNGSLGTCTASNPGNTFIGPAGIVLNQPATYAYISNYYDDTISVCSINTNGSLGTCSSSGQALSGPAGLALNEAGTLLYVPNFDNNTIGICPVNSNGSLGICSASNPGNITNPDSIVLNPVSPFAYVTNTSGNTVSVCPVTVNGTLSTCTQSNPGNTFNAVTGISINASGTYLYVNNSGNNTVSECLINPNGSIGTCTASNPDNTFNIGFGKNGLNSSNTFIYVANSINSTSTVSACSINSNGALTTCTASNPGSTFNGPQGVALN